MRPAFLVLSLLAACSGPPAPDAVLCRDLVHRVCQPPLCAVVATQLAPGDACESTLLARTGCGSDDFAFTTPSRAHFLECRAPLVRLSNSADVPPGCDNVAEALSSCPDLVTFLKGTP